ncbi:MAG: Ig-like domain-containing protein, partial [Bacteroidota bacterium]
TQTENTPRGANVSPESQQIKSEIQKLREKIVIDTADTDDEIPNNDDIIVVTGDVSLVETDEEIEGTAQDLLAEYEVDIDLELERLTSAVRSGDETQVTVVKNRLDDLRGTMVKNAIAVGDEELVARIDGNLDSKITNLEQQVELTEEIVKDRIGEAITRDSDGDGIGDFDEETIYGTDPLVADSDNDGFIDGVEILNGYNPNDASPEAIVAFESPKESGVERPDLLSVESIERNTGATLTPDAPEDVAVISGRGLPNSFVTLYIFSSPTIVTVKTDADGSWNYIFDKELDDGQHEVYVGVTDNAGKIVAKSEPLRFVKTAQAFTPVASAAEDEVTAVGSLQSDRSLLSEEIVLLILSVSIVIIGLILILLGLHLHTHRREEHLVADG